MIIKKQTLQVVGRRNKQQILKDAMRPSPSSTISQPSTGTGGGVPGGVGGCAAGQPVPTHGGSAGYWHNCNQCDDPEAGCFPNWSVDVDNDGIYSTPVVEGAAIDGNHTTDLAVFGAMTELPDTNTSPDTDQQADIRIRDGCGDMERRIWYLTVFLDGDSTSDAPVWSPTDQLGNTEEPYYLTPEPGYSQNNIDRGSTERVVINFTAPFFVPLDYDPLGYGAASGYPIDYIGLDQGFIFFDSAKQWPAYNLQIGAESVMNQWTYFWTLQLNSSSPLYPGVTYYLPTGLTDPSQFPITITQYGKSPWDGSGENFVKAEAGAVTLYSLPAGASAQQSAGTGTSLSGIDFNVHRMVADPSTNANLNFGDRPPGQLGAMTLSATFVSQAGGRDFDSRDTQAETTINYEPGRSYSAIMSPNGERTIYEPPTNVSFYSAVWVNGARMTEGTHYTVNDDKHIVFGTPLLVGDMVEAVFVAA